MSQPNTTLSSLPSSSSSLSTSTQLTPAAASVDHNSNQAAVLESLHNTQNESESEEFDNDDDEDDEWQPALSRQQRRRIRQKARPRLHKHVIAAILSFCTLKEIVKAARTNKLWRRTMLTMQPCIRLSVWHMYQLTMLAVPYWNPEPLPRHAPSWTRLIAQICGDSELVDGYGFDILARSGWFSNLRSIHEFNCNDLDSIIKNMKQTSGIIELKNLNLCESTLLHVIKTIHSFLPGLRTLILGLGYKGWKNFTRYFEYSCHAYGVNLNEFASSMPNLEYFEFHGVYDDEYNDKMNEEVKESSDDEISPPLDFIEMIRRMPNLTSLRIPTEVADGSESFTAAALTQLLRSPLPFDRLIELDLGDQTVLTPAHARALVSLPSLTALHASTTAELSSDVLRIMPSLPELLRTPLKDMLKYPTLV